MPVKKIDAAAFKHLLRVTQGEEDGIWVAWLRVAEDGVYFKFPEDNPLLLTAELMAAFDFLGEVDFAEVKRNPLLMAFPCTVPELEDFTENNGLSGWVYAFDLWRWWTANDTSRREPIDLQRIEIMVAAASDLRLPTMSRRSWCPCRPKPLTCWRPCVVPIRSGSSPDSRPPSTPPPAPPAPWADLMTRPSAMPFGACWPWNRMAKRSCP